MIQYYSKADRRAIILLAVLALVCVSGILLFGSQEASQEQDSGKKQEQSRQGKTVRKDSIDVDGTQQAQTASVFDPNTVDSLTLLAVGLKPRQVKAFLSYRNAGAVFREPLDIARVYCLDDDDIDRLLPKVRIADKYTKRRTKYPIRRETYREQKNTAETRRYKLEDLREKTGRPSSEFGTGKFKSLTKVDLNTADTTLLKRIPGIGSNIARWIVQRREKLGGFHSVDQLMEVQYVSADMLKWFELTTDAHRRNLSEMTFSQMASFPYIGYEKAKAVSNYTRLYGPFKDSDALKASNIFTEEELAKLLPYLEF